MPRSLRGRDSNQSVRWILSLQSISKYVAARRYRRNPSGHVSSPCSPSLSSKSLLLVLLKKKKERKGKKERKKRKIHFYTNLFLKIKVLVYLYGEIKFDGRKRREKNRFVDIATCLCRLILVEKESNGQTRGKVGRV